MKDTCDICGTNIDITPYNLLISGDEFVCISCFLSFSRSLIRYFHRVYPEELALLFSYEDKIHDGTASNAELHEHIDLLRQYEPRVNKAHAEIVLQERNRIERLRR